VNRLKWAWPSSIKACEPLLKSTTLSQSLLQFYKTLQRLAYLAMNVLAPQVPPISFFSPHQAATPCKTTPSDRDIVLMLNNLGSVSPMSSRKRKAEDDSEMSVSPSNSPKLPTRAIARASKKQRGNEVTGRPLALPRLLETLDAQSLRQVLQTICERHPDIGSEVVTSAPSMFWHNTKTNYEKHSRSVEMRGLIMPTIESSKHSPT
jgi:hypothetical protein